MDVDDFDPALLIGEEEEPDISNMAPITQVDAWTVIKAFFDERGLVRQQLDSFDQFITNTVLEVIEDAPVMRLMPSINHAPGGGGGGPGTAGELRHEVKFGKLSITYPAHTEADDNTVTQLYPRDARLRNLTYESMLLVEVTKTSFDAATGVQEGLPTTTTEQLGSVPIMVQSQYCRLKALSDVEKMRVHECTFDQGGYFVVNGSEKVLIAQERQAYNRVYAFHLKPPSKLAWKAEIRSQIGNDNKPRSYMGAHMYRGADEKARAGGNTNGGQIRCVLPYINQDVPAVVVFRALGFQNDREVLSHVVYDFGDNELVEAFRPSLEEARAITSTEGARNYIGTRAAAMTEVSRENRVAYVAELLQKDLLSHVGTDPSVSTRRRKGFFLGYVLHRLLLAACGRVEEDDRDHFANKRLDLAGPLIGSLFRVLFYNMSKTMRALLQRQVDKGREPIVSAALKHDIISRNLRYWCVCSGVETGNPSPVMCHFLTLSFPSQHRHRQLGCARLCRGAQSGRVAGAEPVDVRVFAVPLAPRQHPAGAGGQAGQAAPAAQHAVGDDLPVRNARRRLHRSREKLVPHGVHFKGVGRRPRPRVPARPGAVALGGHPPRGRAVQVESVCERELGGRGERGGHGQPGRGAAQRAAGGPHRVRDFHLPRHVHAGGARLHGRGPGVPPRVYRGGGRGGRGRRRCGRGRRPPARPVAQSAGAGDPQGPRGRAEKARGGLH